MVDRWRQLPFDHALSRMPAVRALVQSLADDVARAEARLPATVPDLGPAVVIDQLAVLVHDAGRAGLDVTDQLVELRRALR